MLPTTNDGLAITRVAGSRQRHWVFHRWAHLLHLKSLVCHAPNRLERQQDVLVDETLVVAMDAQA